MCPQPASTAPRLHLPQLVVGRNESQIRRAQERKREGPLQSAVAHEPVQREEQGAAVRGGEAGGKR